MSGTDKQRIDALKRSVADLGRLVRRRHSVYAVALAAADLWHKAHERRFEAMEREVLWLRRELEWRGRGRLALNAAQLLLQLVLLGLLMRVLL